MTHRYAPAFPRMWNEPEPKCLHIQRRGADRIDLVCVRPKDHEGNHLHDVPPELQVGK